MNSSCLRFCIVSAYIPSISSAKAKIATQLCVFVCKRIEYVFMAWAKIFWEEIAWGISFMITFHYVACLAKFNADDILAYMNRNTQRQCWENFILPFYKFELLLTTHFIVMNIDERRQRTTNLRVHFWAWALVTQWLHLL